MGRVGHPRADRHRRRRRTEPVLEGALMGSSRSLSDARRRVETARLLSRARASRRESPRRLRGRGDPPQHGRRHRRRPPLPRPRHRRPRTSTRSPTSAWSRRCAGSTPPSARTSSATPSRRCAARSGATSATPAGPSGRRGRCRRCRPASPRPTPSSPSGSAARRARPRSPSTSTSRSPWSSTRSSATGCFSPVSLDAPRTDDEATDSPLDRMGGPRPGLRQRRGTGRAAARSWSRCPSATGGSSSCATSRTAPRPRSAPRSASARSRCRDC